MCAHMVTSHVHTYLGMFFSVIHRNTCINNVCDETLCTCVLYVCMIMYIKMCTHSICSRWAPTKSNRVSRVSRLLFKYLERKGESEGDRGMRGRREGGRGGGRDDGNPLCGVLLSSHSESALLWCGGYSLYLINDWPLQSMLHIPEHN